MKELLKNKQWLFEEYVSNNKSQTQIAKIIGCDSWSVGRRLAKFGIPVRSGRETKLLTREDDGFRADQINIINGCLLGDGNISLTSKGITPIFIKNNKFYDHILYVASKLFAHNPQNRISKTSWEGYRLCSLSHIELMPIYDFWYPKSNNRIKCVPRNLILNSETILHWLLDDGSGGESATSGCRVRFASMSFSVSDNNFLCEQFALMGIDAYVTKATGGTNHSIQIAAKSIEKFFKLIGSCPVPSLAYKWRFLEQRKYFWTNFAKLKDSEWLSEEYIQKKRTLADIASEIGCSRQTVANAMLKHNLKTRNNGFKKCRYPELLNKNWLEQKYFTEKRTLKQIADLLGCSLSSVQRGFSLQKIKITNRRPPEKNS